jgi:hypothetical protein
MLARLSGLSVRHYQRAQAGGRAAHALGLALVHGFGFRSGDPTSLYILQEPTWAISGVEPLRGAVEQIVRQCVEVGLVQGKHLSVDGSFVEANAAKESRIPREQLVEAAQIHHTVRQYLKELEQQNPVEEQVHEQDQVSTTDPDSTYATKGGTPARLGYYDNYLVDNQSCVIVGARATAARMSQETVAAQDMLTRFA